MTSEWNTEEEQHKQWSPVEGIREIFFFQKEENTNCRNICWKIVTSFIPYAITKCSGKEDVLECVSVISFDEESVVGEYLLRSCGLSESRSDS